MLAACSTTSLMFVTGYGQFRRLFWKGVACALASRAAVRYWDCRAAWGAIIFKSYSLCDNAIVSIGPIAPSQAEELEAGGGGSGG